MKEPRGAERGSKNQETLLGPLVDIGEYHVTFLVKCVYAGCTLESIPTR